MGLPGGAAKICKGVAVFSSRVGPVAQQQGDMRAVDFVDVVGQLLREPAIMEEPAVMPSLLARIQKRLQNKRSRGGQTLRVLNSG